MSKITFTPNAAGTGTFNVVSPNSNSNRTITLPDSDITLGQATPSIDDNGNATAITIDSSENVLVGKTSAGYNVDGFEARQNGETYVSRSGTPMAINRNSSDGTLLNFYKDGSTVGSIASQFGTGLKIDTQGTLQLESGSNNRNLYFDFDDATPNFYPSPDDTLSIGRFNRRFKDLYLSGGVYLGGTGAANKLDDYEEGTWTPSLYAVTGGAITVSASSTGFYTKVGRLVHVSFSISPFSVSGGTGGATINISGLPFTTQGSGLDSNGSVVGSNGISWSRTDFVALRTYDVSTLGFLVSNNGGSWLWETVSAFTGSSQHVNGTITYMTTA